MAAPVLLAALLFLPSIGERTIFIGDEARYALLARNMVASGDWLVPRMKGEVHMEKSPLFMWAIAALSRPGRAVTELTAALPSALSAIGGVGATLLLGRQMFGRRAGVLAAFALATTCGYYWYARLVLADIMVTFFVTAAAAAFWAAVRQGEERWGLLALFWACLGLAFSAKGPVGLLPILPISAYLVTEHGWGGVRRIRPLMGALIVALVSAPWALAFALQGEESYVQSVLLDDYVGPRLQGWARISDLFFVFGPMGAPSLPWITFLPAAVWLGWWKSENTDTARKFRFLAFWALAYVIIVTLIPHKRGRYLLPVYPALAVMIGWLWDRWATSPASRALRIHGWVWGGTVLATAVALVLLPVRPEVAALIPPTIGQKLVLGGLLLAGAGAAMAAARAGRPLAMFAAVCTSMALVLAYETPILVAGQNREYDVKGLSQRLVSRVGPRDQLVTYQFGPLALEFYTGRAIPELNNRGGLEPLLATGRSLYVVVPERNWADLRASTDRTWTIVDRATFGGREVFVATPVARP